MVPFQEVVMQYQSQDGRIPVFCSHYLKENFLTYSQAGPTSSDYTLLLYDGHSSHVSKQDIVWSLENKISVVCVATPCFMLNIWPLLYRIMPWRRYENEQ